MGDRQGDRDAPEEHGTGASSRLLFVAGLLCALGSVAAGVVYYVQPAPAVAAPPSAADVHAHH